MRHLHATKLGTYRQRNTRSSAHYMLPQHIVVLFVHCWVWHTCVFACLRCSIQFDRTWCKYCVLFFFLWASLSFLIPLKAKYKTSSRLTMDAQLTQQHREDICRQLQQWGVSRNVPRVQLEQMVQAILAGHHDAQIVQSMPVAQKPPISYHPSYVPVVALHGLQTPFGIFPWPTMPPLPVPMGPRVFTPPPLTVPNMFPGGVPPAVPHAPNVQTTRTLIPGGEIIQQSSSCTGQQGTGIFQYASSSTSMNFTPDAQVLPQPPQLAPIHYPQQPILPLSPAGHIGPAYTPEPLPPQPQQQAGPVQPPQIMQGVKSPPAHARAPNRPSTPDPAFNPAVAPQEPQNPRLAAALRNQLHEGHEETYFSDPPGMPDNSVPRWV